MTRRKEFKMRPMKYKITYYDSSIAQTKTICPYVLDIESYLKMLVARKHVEILDYMIV